MIRLKYCSVQKANGGVLVTFFASGAWTWTSDEADDVRRWAASHCGLGHDLPRYNLEHEFTHAFLAERMWDAPSPVLWNAAHHRAGNIVASKYEERFCYHFQRYLALGDAAGPVEYEWPYWKPDALALLEAYNVSQV